MVADGITRSRLPAANDVACTLNDPRVPNLAATLGTTRSAAAMELWRDRLAGALVVIGNAPTALFRLLELLDEGEPPPAAVIGIPVGFVGAAEVQARPRRGWPRAVPDGAWPPRWQRDGGGRRQRARRQRGLGAGAPDLGNAAAGRRNKASEALGGRAAPRRARSTVRKAIRSSSREPVGHRMRRSGTATARRPRTGRGLR